MALRISAILIYLLMLFPAKAASWSDAGAYDVSWYNKNQTSFTISTPQELAGLAYIVNNNITTFSGSTIYIGADINLNGRDWIPIGKSNYVFQGKFEGLGHIVNGISIVSDSNGNYGFWTELKNSTINDINFSGSISVDGGQNGGLIAASATNCEFNNIGIEIFYSFYRTRGTGSTEVVYNSNIGGAIGYSKNCKYNEFKGIFNLNFKFGYSNGSTLSGRKVLNVGGLVGLSEGDIVDKCQTDNNYDILINGYIANSYYSHRNSSIYVGGIVGNGSDGSTVITSCLAKTDSFKGTHNTGNYDNVYFQYGGITGCVNTYNSNTILKNCVAITSNYFVTGHPWSGVAPGYHAYSYFGGVTKEKPKSFGGCYSNNNTVKTVKMIGFDGTCENGNTSYSSTQMNTKTFVDELNFYSQLEFDTDIWMLDKNGKLSIKKEDNAPIKVSTISLNPSSKTIEVGNGFQIIATVSPSDVTDKTITWTSSNNSIASVSSSGYVTAKKAGTTTITCTANDGSGVTAKCNVIVEEKEDPSINLNTHSLTCRQDEWAGELYPVSYNGPSLNWNYNENFVLCQKHPTMKDGLKIKGLAIGETNITVSNSKGGKDVCRLTVSPKDRYDIGDTIKIADDKIAIQYLVLSNSPKTCAIDNIGQSEISATFTIPEIVAGYTVTEVGKEAFHYNAFLKQVIIPETVRYIGEDAFSYCFNIEQISFPSSLEMIGWAAFTHTNLKKVIFSNGLKTIGEFAFAFSTIEDVVLVDGLEEIKECAFYRTPCKNLTLPNTLKSIETEAFNAYNDHSYNKITSRIENPFPIADNVFNDLTYQNATLIVPASSKHMYERALGWKNFKNIETYGEANTEVVIYEGLNEDNTTCDWTFETYDVDDSSNYALSGNQVWKWEQYNGKYYLMANAHEFSAPFYVNAFAYSPAINIKESREFTISFDHAAKFQESGLFSHYLVRLYEVNPEGKVGELLSIAPEIPVLPKAGSWAYVNSGDITLKLDELQANVNSIFIVLFYHGDSDNGANRWQVKNLKMTSSEAAAVQDIIVDDSVSCYPIEVYNLSGVKVSDSIDNLPAGIYIIRQGFSVSKISIR